MGGFRNGKNVENSPQVNTRAVFICTYACMGYKRLLKNAHTLHKNAFCKKVKKAAMTKGWYNKKSNPFHWAVVAKGYLQLRPPWGEPFSIKEHIDAT